MSKKKSTKTPRVSSKQKLADYREKARTFIQTLRYPKTIPAFETKSYETVEGKKMMVKVSIPEIFAIVATAKQLGKKVQLTTGGFGDNGTLYFQYVEDITQIAIPSELF